MAATMSEARELFMDELADILYVERTLEKLLGQLAREASDTELRSSFEEHREQTRGQITNLERVFEAAGKRAQAKRCPGIDGLREEHDEFMAEHGETPEGVRDLFLTGAGARTEHYEIAAYTGLVGMAKAMGERESAGLLEENLRQEKETLKRLETMGKRLAKEVSGNGRRRTGGGAR